MIIHTHTMGSASPPFTHSNSFQFSALKIALDNICNYLQLYTIHIRKKNNGVIPRERERDGKVNLELTKSTLSLSGYYAQHISTISRLSISPPCHLGLKPFVHIRGTSYSVLCVTDDCQSPTFKEYTQLCYVGPQVQHN